MVKYDKKSETEIIDTLILPDGPETVAKNYVPEGFKKVEDYLQDTRETFDLDIQADEDNRREALDDKRFVAGEQWDPLVLESRKGLPCLTINTIPQFTAQIVGDWRSARNAIKVLPAEDGDVDVASIRGDLVRSIEMKSRAPRIYDNAFESAVHCGDGAFRICVEYAREDVFDQEIMIRPIDDALSVVWDRMSVDPTARDATHCFVNDSLPRNEFEKRWPEQNPSDLEDKELTMLRASGWCNKDSVRVTEHWRLIERKKLIAMFEDGSVRDLDVTTMDQLSQEHGPVVRTRYAPCTYAQMHLITGHAILAGPFEYKLNRLPIIRMVGHVINIDGNRIRSGLVRPLKDIMRMKNFWRSMAAEMLGYAPKAQWIANENAVEGRELDFRKAHLSRDPLLVVNDGAVIDSDIKRLDPPPVQIAMLQESNVNTQDMKDVTGIHDASLGIKSNETSGRAIMARQREGDIANLTYHDNGNAALLEAGDVINQLIPQIYDGTRVVRLIGEDQTPKFMKVNDPMDPNSVDLSVGQYDVALSTGTSYMTRRVEAAAAMMEAVQVYPEMMQIAGDLVAKAQDWPGAQELAERLKKTIPPHLLGPDEQPEGGGAGMPAVAPQQMMDLMTKFQELEQENQELKQEQMVKLQELEIKAFDAETKRLQVLGQLEIDQADLEMQDVHSELDREDRAEDRKVKVQSAKKDSSSKSG